MPVELSPREVDVLRGAAAGLTAKETAEHLGISASAVNLYLSRAQLKLGAKNKTHAVVIAINQGTIG